MFKPQVIIKNTGTIALKDYHAKLWFRVPEGKELYPNESVVEGNIVLYLTNCLRSVLSILGEFYKMNLLEKFYLLTYEKISINFCNYFSLRLCK